MKNRKALFTITFNNDWLLPKWLNYYCQHFLMSDIYVLEHVTDKSKPPYDSKLFACHSTCNQLRVYNTTAFDHIWLRDIVSQFQRFLLQSYEYVLFTETDEFIVPCPEYYSGLSDYIDRMTAPCIKCSGFEIQQLESEAPLVLVKENYIGQRTKWHRSHLYSKPLLANYGLNWSIGFHDVYQNNVPFDPQLYLLHYKKIDFDLLLKKNIDTARKPWSEYDLMNGHGHQHLLRSPVSLRNWFNEYVPVLEPIPEKLKKVPGL